MKALIKSKEQLVAEGWKEGNYKNPNRTYYNSGMFLGKSLNPEASLTTFEMRVLGKEVDIIDGELTGDNPRFKVLCEDYTTTLQWRLFVQDFGTKLPNFSKPGFETITIKGHGEIKVYDNGLVNFDCGYKKMTREVVLDVMDKLLIALKPKKAKKK
jgi:hypothetical protein